MGKKLAGVQFVYNAIDQDYCCKESIESMLAVCDNAVIVDAGSNDGTQEMLFQHFQDQPLIRITCGSDEFHNHDGPERLSFFTNVAIDYAEKHLGADYILYVQADEVVHQDSFANIRAAVEEGAEAYVMNRYNLFKDPYHMLNVEQSKKPCSTEVVRLAKSCYRAYSDAEHLAVPTCQPFNNNLAAIELFHMGFVRHKVKHLAKIRHMLTEVFKMGMDTRAENCEEFIWDRFFKEEDLIPIPKALPVFVKQWARERYPELSI